MSAWVAKLDHGRSASGEHTFIYHDGLTDDGALEAAPQQKLGGVIPKGCIQNQRVRTC